MKTDIPVTKILLVKLSSIGDVVHSLPVLKALRQKYPQAHISWVVKPFCKEVIEDNPYLDEILILERKKCHCLGDVWCAFKDFFRLIREIRRRRFDMVVDLQGLFYTGLITFFSGSHIRIGFANARECSPALYNHKVKVPTMDLHAVDRYFLMAETLGVEDKQRDFTMRISEKDREFIWKYLKKQGIQRGKTPLITMNPSARWTTKEWNKEKFAELADTLHDQWGANIILIGSRQDIPLVRQVGDAMRHKPVLAAGQTSLKQLVALLDAADLLITNDTGPMHIASAVGTSTVALFGPTDKRRTGPYGEGHMVVEKNVFCSPCFRKRCPNDMLCMEMLTVNDVLHAIRRGLNLGEFAKINPVKAERLAQAPELADRVEHPRADILVLSDTKAGHLNQSLGMVRRLPNSSHRIAEIRFKSTFHRGLVWLAGMCNYGKVPFLRRTLTPESVRAIMASSPRVVLSTGVSVAPINLIAGKIFRARTAVSMKPGSIRLSRFDLVVVPMHDEPPKVQNVLQTLGAPNLIDAKLLAEEAGKLGKTLDLKKKIRIGVLMGGETRDCYISRETGIALIGQIKRLCQELDAEVLWSTSRRTPRNVEKMIAGAFKNDPACRLMALASAGHKNPVPGILGLCDIIVVTEESTSMVSEAASSGKTVAVVRIDRHYNRRLKQERTIQELCRLGYVMAADPEDLFSTVMKAWPPRTAPKVLGDTILAAHALENLLRKEIIDQPETHPTLAPAI